MRQNRTSAISALFSLKNRNPSERSSVSKSSELITTLLLIARDYANVNRSTTYFSSSVDAGLIQIAHFAENLRFSFSYCACRPRTFYAVLTRADSSLRAFVSRRLLQLSKEVTLHK